MLITFQDSTVHLSFTPYIDNGNTAIQLVDVETKELLANITTNVNETWGETYVMIKVGHKAIEPLIEQNIIKRETIREYTDEPNNLISVYELTPDAARERASQFAENEYHRLFLPKTPVQ